jgi:hypothetical protein
VSDKNLSKIESSVLEDNDIFWKLRAFGNHILTQKDIYDMYQMMLNKQVKKDICLKFGNYVDYIRANSWYHIMNDLIDDKVFLKNYVDTKDENGYTLLLTIVWEYHRISQKYDIEKLVKKVVENGANIYFRKPLGMGRTDYTNSPYEIAKMKRCTDIVKIFEDYEASKKLNPLPSLKS